MSRTYRRKSLPVPRWIVRDYDWIWYEAYGTWSYYEVGSKEYNKALAMHYSDVGTHRFREPGPSWFRNLYTERPQRREAKRQLRKFMVDEEFEVMLNSKDKLEYWT